MRRALLPFVLSALLPLAGQTPGGFDAHAERGELVGGELRLLGHAYLRDRALLLVADEMRVNEKAGIAIASGHVVLTNATLRLLADRVEYHRDGTYTAEHVRLGTDPYYGEGASASGTPTEITLQHARLVFGEPGPWQPTLTADSVTIGPGRQIRSTNSLVGIGHTQPFPLPRFQQSLAAPLIPYGTVTAGLRSSLGLFLEAGLHLPITPSLRLGGDLGIYTQRGILFGPSGTYGGGGGETNFSGSFHSGYINDHGDRKSDLLDRPIPADRAFFAWRHDEQIGENLTVSAQVNWWKDSEVLRDFRPREFFPLQEPDTYLETVYTGQNYFLTAFARFQPNAFHAVQQRLPEIRFDLVPTPLGGGVNERLNASVAVLRDRPPEGGGSLRSDRLDLYYSLERPVTVGDWLTFTPVVGTRVTHYTHGQIIEPFVPVTPVGFSVPTGSPAALVLAPADPAISNPGDAVVPLTYFGSTYAAAQAASGSGPVGPTTRVLGEFGFDLLLRGSGTFDYQNEAWKIAGLRHLVTPRIGYRLIPESRHGSLLVPGIDRQAFSTYLPPLGLGDLRNVDDLGASHLLRVGVDNTLQTRDPSYGSRDLMVFNVAEDFQFKPRAGEHGTSEIHTDLALMPARWLQVDQYESFSPQTFTLREFNTGLTVHDGDAWSVRFSNNYLRRQLDDFALEGRFRITEAYEALSRLRYDARKSRFNEQAYGLTQNLGNTWLVSYLVSLYSGPRRESHFGVSVQIDTVRF